LIIVPIDCRNSYDLLRCRFHLSHQGADLMASSTARAEASRRNGARSRGPVTAPGKARSAQNALEHGLRAQSAVTQGESAAEFAAFAAALRAELTPDGILRCELAARVAAAAWRARRADRLEAALLEGHLAAGAAPGREHQAVLAAGLVRDGHGPRAFETLVRYRGSVLAELFRALGALRLLQAAAPDRIAAVPSAADLPRPAEPVRCHDRTNPRSTAEIGA
jgi:hypothetical protein